MKQSIGVAWVGLGFAVAIGIFVSVASPSHSWAKQYILCARNAEITAVNPTTPRADKDGDTCTGTVLLQGISYECTAPKEVERKVSSFLSDLTRNGREYCESFCQKRGTVTRPCHGSFVPPDKCGYTIPAKSAPEVGVTMEPPCNPACGGTAFAYCSIYHASFLKVVPEMFDGMAANCFCKGG